MANEQEDKPVDPNCYYCKGLGYIKYPDYTDELGRTEHGFNEICPKCSSLKPIEQTTKQKE